MNMFKHTEVTTTQHYTYWSESRCSSYCGFLMDFAARGGEGYELVDVCRRELPTVQPQSMWHVGKEKKDMNWWMSVAE